MAVTTEQDIDRLLKEKLREDGVLDQLESTSLFFSPEGVLVEVVLKDASAVDRAEQAIRQVGQELEGEGMYLLPTVRAVWEVESVERVSLPPGPVPAGVLGIPFRAMLRSGSGHQEVWVNVLPAAFDLLVRGLTSVAKDEIVKNTVKYFLVDRVTFGGSAPWDPRTSRVVQLSESDAWYLINRPYEKLKNEIDLIFRSHESASEFLAAVKTAGVKVGALRDVLPHFPSGGPFLSGHGFTSSEE